MTLTNVSTSIVVMLIALFALGKVLTPLLATCAMAFAIERSGKPRWVFYVTTFALAFFFLCTTTDLTVPNRFTGLSLHVSFTDDWIANTQIWQWQAMQVIVVLTTALAFWLRSRKRFLSARPAA